MEKLEIKVENFATTVHELVSGALSEKKTILGAKRIREDYVKMFSDGVKNYGELVDLANKIFGKYYSSFREAIAG